MRPVVGVTSYTPAVSDDKYVLPRQYIDSLRRAGAEVVLLPEGDSAALIGRLDALVLAGGGDLDPALFGGTIHDTTYMVDRIRDDFELDLLDSALASEMPVLAICRGMQILNVSRGGTLIAHVPDRFGDSIVHRAPPREPIPHTVELESGSRLARIVGDGVLDVVSWHHQAIDRIGDGLAVAARSTDGLIEAVEVDAPGWVFGVQWHPELNADTNSRQAALFSDLVGAAERFRRG